MNNEVVSKDVALDELELFINTFVKKPVKREELEETYPDVLDAIIDGYLSFDSDSLPTLRLKQPIKSEEGNIILSELSFKTRIKPSTLAALAKGLDLRTDALNLQLKMTSYLIGQSTSMIDRLGRYDLDVVNQVSTVFS